MFMLPPKGYSYRLSRIHNYALVVVAKYSVPFDISGVGRGGALGARAPPLSSAIVGVATVNISFFAVSTL